MSKQATASAAYKASWIICYRMDPLWNSLVVGGLQTDKEGQLKPFLGFLGMIGTSYEDAHVATGEHAQQKSILIVYELQTYRLA